MDLQNITVYETTDKNDKTITHCAWYAETDKTGLIGHSVKVYSNSAEGAYDQLIAALEADEKRMAIYYTDGEKVELDENGIVTLPTDFVPTPADFAGFVIGVIGMLALCATVIIWGQK